MCRPSITYRLSPSRRVRHHPRPRTADRWKPRPGPGQSTAPRVSALRRRRWFHSARSCPVDVTERRGPLKFVDAISYGTGDQGPSSFDSEKPVAENWLVFLFTHGLFIIKTDNITTILYDPMNRHLCHGQCIYRSTQRACSSAPLLFLKYTFEAIRERYFKTVTKASNSRH